MQHQFCTFYFIWIFRLGQKNRFSNFIDSTPTNFNTMRLSTYFQHKYFKVHTLALDFRLPLLDQLLLELLEYLTRELLYRSLESRGVPSDLGNRNPRHFASAGIRTRNLQIARKLGTLTSFGAIKCVLR